MNKFYPVLVSISVLFSSCLSMTAQERRLEPKRSTNELRIETIRTEVSGEPGRAIHLIGVYKTIYPDWQESDAAAELESLEAQSLENLRQAQLDAVREERYDDAASLARSLSSLGITVESTGQEPDLLLADAKKQLAAGNSLGAFLSAIQADELKALSPEDALFFLEKAMEARQRRTAARFLTIAEAAGGEIPEELRLYAEGGDAPPDMIKGVATILIDRGMRIERGRGIPDRMLGSAFFVDASGLLITNYHVIESEVDPSYEGISRMYIRMGDASSPRIPAKVIGWDKAMDLALIKADLKPEYVFSVVDRITPRIGETIYAIGSPVGLERTVTQGIVSALGRHFLQIGDVIQIDAAVNHGNSGGPVVDRDGRLVGIVFAGIEAFQGLNFAVPAERLAAALPAMIRGGKAERPWLGLTLNETVNGAEIIYTAPFTPASEQRIKEGAFIRTINGKTIEAPQGALIPALQDQIFHTRPGELVALEFGESRQESSNKVVLISVPRPDVPLAEAAKKDSRERMAAPLFGLILSPSLGKSFSSSYLVKKVVRGSIADEASLSELDSVSIRSFRVWEKEGYAVMDINVKKRRQGYMETVMQLPAALDSPDTL
ncbi:MAG: S1C family serine protease [Treponema sp.]|jgi:S1-C subfamily serine protease|nr:S1C family serine protease [Treponema sp.]